MSRQVERIVIVWAVFALLCSVYLLTYRGLFQSIDELAMFSMAESLVQGQSLQTPQLAFARYHNRVGRLEPLQPLLAAPLYWLAVRSTWLGNIHTVMLLNVLITAATGAVLCVVLLRLGHPNRRAVLGALVYGLATIAWPYGRSFYREPLVSLLFTMAVLGWVRWRQTHRLGHLAMVGLCLALAPVAKATATLVWPAFGLAFILEPGLSRRVRVRRGMSVVAFSALGVLVLALLYAMRHRSGLSSILVYVDAWTTPALVLSRIFGLLVGSGRGLFVFSPVLLLSLPGLVLLWRRDSSLAVLVVAALVSLVLGYSSYEDWHGGLVWGSRFLVPVVPLLVLPVVECLSVKSRGWRLAMASLVAMSAFIQLAASTVDYSIQVTGDRWADLIAYAQSPVAQQIALWYPKNFDMLWWHGPLPAHLADVYVNGWIALLPAASLLGATALVLAVLGLRRLSLGGAGSLDRGLWVGSGLLGLILTAGIVVLLWQAPIATGGYAGANPAELRRVVEIVNGGYGDERVIVTVSNDFHINVLLDGFKGRFVHHWLSPVQVDGFDKLTRPSLPAQSLYLIVDRVHMPAGLSGREIELWLNARLFRYDVEWVGGGYEVYSYLFPPHDLASTSVGYRWSAGMEMLSAGLAPGSAQAGTPVWVESRLSAVERPDANYDLFLQLLSPDGRFVDGVDGSPQFGGAPTSRWVPGEVIVDRRAMLVPGDAPAGTYRVIAGFYRGDERQPVVGRDGEALGTHVVVGEVEVVP
jgi:hypothetical protein